MKLCPSRLLICLLLAAGALGGSEAPASAATATGAIRILIVTGIDYPGHHWRETTPVLQEELGKDPRLKVEAELIRRATAWAARRDPVAPKQKAAAELKTGGKLPTLASIQSSEVEPPFNPPAGFAIRLIAAEPDIANPMTMCVE